MNKTKYGFGSNLVFMWKKHWQFDKIFLALLLCGALFHVLASLMSILLPKLVLDGLTRRENLPILLLEIAEASLLLTLLNAGGKKAAVSSDEHAWKFFFFAGYSGINAKRMAIDYESYSSPSGKNAAQKALMSVSGYTWESIVGFYAYLKDFLMNLLGFVSYAAILMSVSPWVIVFLLFSYFLNSGAAVLVEKIRHKLRDKEAEIWRKKRYFSQQTSLHQYAKDIRIYSLAGWLKELRQTLLTEELQFYGKQGRRDLLQLLLQGLLVFLRDGLVYAYLIYAMFRDPSMTVGTLSVYLAAVAGFGGWLSELVENGQGLMETNGYVKDYRAFMDMDAQPKEKSHVRLPDPPYSIRMEHVSYRYPESDCSVLDDISLEIGAGENLALVGVNGAGKTTLIKLICGLLHPTAGEIYINGVNANTFSRTERFNLFGAVFQDINIMPVSVAENITFNHNPSAEDEKRMWAALERAGMAERVRALPDGADTTLMKQFNKDGVNFSGGELQKLLLARALYRDAPILILDEPTAALDPIAENELYLKYHALTKGKTSIYISHRLSSTGFCDRIVVLDGARLVESGTHEQLMGQGGIYAKMFEVSSKYYREDPECNV